MDCLCDQLNTWPDPAPEATRCKCQLRAPDLPAEEIDSVSPARKKSSRTRIWLLAAAVAYAAA